MLKLFTQNSVEGALHQAQKESSNGMAQRFSSTRCDERETTKWVRLDTPTLDALQETLGDETLHALTEHFIKRLDHRYARMTNGVACKDRDELAAAAHALIGAAASIGCIGLADFATALERQAHKENMQNLHILVEKLPLLAERTQRLLAQQGYIGCSND